MNLICPVWQASVNLDRDLKIDDGFNIVSVWIQQKCGEVVRGVIGPQTGFPVADEAPVDASLMELRHRGLIGRRKGDVRGDAPVELFDQEDHFAFTHTTKPSGGVIRPLQLDVQRSQCCLVKSLAPVEINNLNLEMIVFVNTYIGLRKCITNISYFINCYNNH